MLGNCEESLRKAGKQEQEISAKKLRERIAPYLNPGWQAVLNPGQQMPDRVRALLHDIFAFLHSAQN